MFRRWCACVSAAALAAGLLAAPHTHVHADAAAAHDAAPGTSLRHAHLAPHDPAAPHSHSDEDGAPDHDGLRFTAGGFLFAKVTAAPLPQPIETVVAVLLAAPDLTRLSTPDPRPRLHDPPAARPLSSRAPPATPSAA